MQALVDEGTPIDIAAMIVRDTWPTTGGDDHYIGLVGAVGGRVPVGPYAVLLPAEIARRDAEAFTYRAYAPMIAATVRATPDDLTHLLDFGGQTDLIATIAAERVAAAMRLGVRFDPEEVATADHGPAEAAQLATDAADVARVSAAVLDATQRLW